MELGYFEAYHGTTTAQVMSRYFFGILHVLM